MFINLHTLTHLQVLTESGVKLGRIYDINFEIDSQSVKSYAVRRNILDRSYLIKPTQIISINLDKIVVEDSLIKIIDEARGRETKAPIIVGVAMSEKE